MASRLFASRMLKLCLNSSIVVKHYSRITTRIRPQILHKCVVDHNFHQRQLWGWLNSIFNKFDSGRVKEVGADRACAEWLLRCGAHVRWSRSEKFQTNYNSLPPGDYSRHKIEEINADDAAIMSIGFPHLDGLEYLKKTRFYNCGYLDDESLVQLSRVKHTLQELEVGSCALITDKGIISIIELQQLKELKLYDLPSVKDKRGCLQTLKNALPKCTIEFPDAIQSTSET